MSGQKTNQLTDSVKLDMEYKMEISIDDEEIIKFDFIARDSFGAKGKARVRIKAFENIPPVAVMQVTKTGLLSPYETPGNSFDPDKAYGGGVIRYKYKIGSDYEIQTTVSKLKYTLPVPGIRNVSVAVQDNQDAWSKEVTQEIIF